MQTKTIITSVLLFSAGALFVTAATPAIVNGIDYADSKDVGSVNMTDAAGSGSIAVSITGGIAWSGPNFNNNKALLWVKSDGGLKLNANMTMGALKLDSDVVISNSIANLVGAVTFNAGTQVLLSGNGFLDVNCDTISKVNISGLNAGSTIYLNEKGKLTMAIGQWGNNAKNISLNLLAADVATAAGSNYNVVDGSNDLFLITRKIATGSLSATTALTFDFNGLNMTKSEENLIAGNLTLDDLGAYTITQTNGELSITYVASASAIPEPSAFGLLAGIGALALVVSRRRRSRKAA